ncbi:MAG: hypothetical protein M3Q58_15010 [Bacteroidota bacterium]|nr:hypothetical protein [Bacteroidota bacterium]
MLIITGGFIYKRHASFNKPYFYISLAWFLIPLLTGYFYSVYFSSVLQFSILIFTFPFLLFLLFSNLPNFNPALKSAIILILCSLSIFTLIYDRKYYDEGYIALFKQNVKNIKQAKQDYGDEVLTFLDGFKDVSEHYLTKESNSNLNWLFDFNSSKEFVSFIENNPRKKLALACISSIPPEYIPLILNFYPVVLEKKDYFGGSYYLFSITGKEKKQIQRTISFNDFENDYPVWNEINKNNITDSIPVSGPFSYLINSEQEWGPSFSFDLKDHIKHRNDFLDISVKILPMENLEEILLVSVLESMGKTIEWRGTPINQNEFKIQGDWIKTFQSVKLSDITYIPNDTRVKVFIWNKSKNKFLMDDFEIKVREGNPLLYGIFEEH